MTLFDSLYTVQCTLYIVHKGVHWASFGSGEGLSNGVVQGTQATAEVIFVQDHLHTEESQQLPELTTEKIL